MKYAIEILNQKHDELVDLYQNYKPKDKIEISMHEVVGWQIKELRNAIERLNML